MVNNFVVTPTDPVFVRATPTAIDLAFTYNHISGAPVPQAPNTHVITITATNVDLQTDISQAVFDTLHVVSSEETDLGVAIEMQDVSNKTISVRYGVGSIVWLVCDGLGPLITLEMPSI